MTEVVLYADAASVFRCEHVARDSPCRAGRLLGVRVHPQHRSRTGRAPVSGQPPFALGEKLEADSAQSAMADQRGSLRLVDSLAAHEAVIRCSLDLQPGAELLGYFVLSEHFASEIAAAADLVRRDVVGQLDRLSSNLTSLLLSPQGWTALGGYIAVALDADVSFTPTIH